MKCWNCNKEFESSYDRHLDHNHENGLFRSIVCRNCNSYDSIIRFEPNITPKQKKWIVVFSLTLLSAINITTPINLREMVPTFFTNPLLGSFSIVDVTAYLGILCAFWLVNKQTD